MSIEIVYSYDNNLSSKELMCCGDFSCIIKAHFSMDISRKKKNGKMPKRIHKSEREKMKRESLNELFLALANSLGEVWSFRAIRLNFRFNELYITDFLMHLFFQNCRIRTVVKLLYWLKPLEQWKTCWIRLSVLRTSTPPYCPSLNM